MKPKKIAIVGSPNVGKSSIFNNLSGRYATVSNYPGTTVELFSAAIHCQAQACELIDTPGMYSLLPLSEEERIARQILIKDRPDVVIHVAEANNLERALILTLQLIEADLPLILAVNMMDEAQKQGRNIAIERLKDLLGIPVVAMVSVRQEGVKELKEAIAKVLVKDKMPQLTGKILQYPPMINEEIEYLSEALQGNYAFSKQLMSVLLLTGDIEITRLVEQNETKEVFQKIKDMRRQIDEKVTQPVEYIVNLALREKAGQLIKEVVREKNKKSDKLSRLLGDLTLRPVVGIPLLILFLYYGLYKLVGEFGAGVLVDFLETRVFEGYINPFFITLFERIIPVAAINSLFVGEYGIITLGFRYAFAIILPIVGIFFFVFSFAEDTGYLPRIGAMLDRLFKKIGLSGKAVIPIVLGLGCDTMAVMVTRILPTKRERVIATLLISLSVPCSAQLGVIMAVLAPYGKMLAAWFFIISLIFATTGFFLNRILKGKRPSFHIELPPLRLPQLSNIFVKTYTRLKWYFKEVMPLFIWASVIIWAGQITHIFDVALKILSYPLAAMGLSSRLSSVFLFGFFRRDYGAAGLYDLQKQGLLSARELLVAAVVLTLFLPCIAQFLMNIKERGVKTALSIAAFILVFSFSVGVVLNKILVIMGMQ